MNLGRLLIGAGLLLVVLGVVVLLLARSNLPLGRLPGDIVYRGKNTTVYFPWVTCLVISVILTLLMWVLNRRS
jgi:fumarate reductase subunit D